MCGSLECVQAAMKAGYPVDKKKEEMTCACGVKLNGFSCRGCVESGRTEERNRIADVLDEEANPDAYSHDVKFAFRRFAERLRKGEI